MDESPTDFTYNVWSVTPLVVSKLPHVCQEPNQFSVQHSSKFVQKPMKLRQTVKTHKKTLNKRVKPKRQHLTSVRHVLKVRTQRSPPMVKPQMNHSVVKRLRKRGTKLSKRVSMGMQSHVHQVRKLPKKPQQPMVLRTRRKKPFKSRVKNVKKPPNVKKTASLRL